MAMISTGMTRHGSRFVFVALLALAGCQSERMTSLDTRPAPLNAAPSGTVTSNTLPPPTAPGATNPAAFPPPPGTTVPGTDPALASAAPGQVAAPANAPDVTKEAMVGAWKVSAGPGSCQMMLSLTKMSADFRAASLRCPGTAAGVAAWNVAGKQVVLKDNGGNTVARLYSSGPERFDGQTTDGQPISFSR